MLVFEERGKPEYPEKNLSEQRREPTNSVPIWRRVRESNPGNIGGRRALSSLRQPCSPYTPRLKYAFRLEENVSRFMFPRASKTQWLPWQAATWTFDSHVIRSCTLKRRQICVPVSLMSKSHWSRQRFSLEKAFIIQQENWLIIRQWQIRLTKWKIWTFQVF